jgi:hypothetical protein
MRRGVDSNPQGPCGLACFRGRCRHQSACLSGADGAGLEPAWGVNPSLRFPAGHLAISVSHPRAEHAGLEPATPVGVAP